MDAKSGKASAVMVTLDGSISPETRSPTIVATSACALVGSLFWYSPVLPVRAAMVSAPCSTDVPYMMSEYSMIPIIRNSRIGSTMAYSIAVAPEIQTKGTASAKRSAVHLVLMKLRKPDG